MAKSRTSYSQAQRGYPYSTANARVAVPRLSWSRLSPVPLSFYEDRREFHPVGDYRRAVSFRGLSQGRAILKRAPGIANNYFGMPSDSFRFAVPSHVIKCVRRKQRREVMFAMDKTRKGAGARYRRRDYYSGVSC